MTPPSRWLGAVRAAVVLAFALLGPGAAPDCLARQPAGPPAQALKLGQEVQIAVEFFGVGGVVRPGDWAGIRLTLTDTALVPRAVAVRLHLDDSDGDTGLYSRVVTLNPGVAMGVWLYARMPWSLQAGAGGSVIKVSVAGAEAREDGSFAIGRQIGALRISPGRVVPAQDGLLAIVGRSAMGLEQLATTLGSRPVSPSAHEVVQPVGGLTPASVPDQWQGWGAYRLIVWNDGDPAETAGDLRAQAIREWVHRGGHLVIVLPAVGNPWTSPGNPLADLLPAAKIERLQDVDLRAYANLLTNRAEDVAALPRSSVLHRFVIAPDTEPADATPILVGPDGCVAVRRLVGTGMVTVVGFDLAARTLSQQQLPAADAFWNRVIGRRADSLSYALITKMQNAGAALSRLSDARWIDGRIASAIAKSRTASVGILMGLIVFAAYWLLAGPVGFGLLKSRGWERHSWLAFVAMAGVFTLVAWTGASVMRPKKESVSHYTVLDHVYGQPVQRARAWAGVLLPTYGEQRVSVADPAPEGPWSQAITPWADPQAESNQSFPDARDYLVDVRRMTGLTVPARSTIKQFQLDWLGRSGWSMPVATSPDERPTLTPEGALRGSLLHRLPAPLVDVQVILVRGQTGEPVEASWRVSRLPHGLARFEAFAWKLPTWKPQESLSLSGLVPNAAAGAVRWLDDLVPSVSLGGALTEAEFRGDGELVAALFDVVGPPDVQDDSGTGPRRVMLRRRLVHTLDICRWFTQPCLIIVGTLEDSVCPVPLAVDGRTLNDDPDACRGTTVVRWVYPLAPRPPVFSGAAAPTPQAAPPPTGAS